MVRLLTIALVLAMPAAAQESAEGDDYELRPAPEYFVQTVIATTTAAQLARSCSTLSTNPPVMQRASTEVLERLDADGFDITRADGGIIEPTERFAEMQEAFLAKHGLKVGAVEEAVCAAGRAEIAEGTEIGSYLVEVAE